MFHHLRSPSPSPCPSPVRDLVANLRMVSSPKRDKYKTMIESQTPIISRGRLTMNGGFPDLRPPYPLEKEGSLDSDQGTSSVSSSSRSTSFDSNDPTIDPVPAKVPRRFVKIPRKAFKNVIQQLSPRLSKKLVNEEKKYTPFAPQDPVWPNCMSTYARGVCTTQVQSLVAPDEPSLTAMKARAMLEDSRNIRKALQMLATDRNKKEQTTQFDDSSCSSSSYSSDQEDPEDPLDDSIPKTCIDDVAYQPTDRIAKNLMQFHINKAEGVLVPEVFPINPKIKVEGPISDTDTSSEGNFRDESIFDALDLDSVPTLTPEEFACQRVTEVRNIHLCREYIILETGPPTDSVFV